MNRLINPLVLLWKALTGSVRHVVNAFAQALMDRVHDTEHLAALVLADTRRFGRRITRGARAVVRSFIELLVQLGADIRHAVRFVVRATVFTARLLLRGVRAAWKKMAALGQVVSHIFLRITAPVITPIRKVFARKAREEVLGVAVTPDHKSHRELVILLFGLAAILTVAGLVATQNTVPHLGLRHTLGQLTPQRILQHLATYSPAKLLGLTALGIVFLALVWFWISMVRDAFRRDFALNTERTRWRLITMLFIPGAIVYFAKVYNRWTIRQFLGHHFLSVMVTSMALIIGTSTYGTLTYFNQKAEAQVRTNNPHQLPNLDVDAKTKNSLLSRTKYGTPLTPAAGGRVDPFAPVPGLNPVAAPTVSPSPSPSATPNATPGQ